MLAALNSHKTNNRHPEINISKALLDIVLDINKNNMEYCQQLQSQNEGMDIDTEMNETSSNNNNNIFNDHKDKILNILSNSANKAFDNDDNICSSIYSFPMEILEYVHQYSISWRWNTYQQQVKLSKENTKMFVNNTNVSIFDRRCVGTASIAIDGIDNDNFGINANEVYLFEFNYISIGIGSLDAIIGIVDNNFEFNSNSLGVGNQNNSFNWGLRSDGLLCYNNENIDWNKDNLNIRLKNEDNLCMLLNTNDNKIRVQLWLNNKLIYSGDNLLDILSKSSISIAYPLKIMGSAARGGGFEIIRGCKLQ